MVDVTPISLIGMVALWFSQYSLFVLVYSMTSYLLLSLLCCGFRLQGCRGEAWFIDLQTSRRHGHLFMVSLLTSLHLSSLGFHGWDWVLSHRWLGFAWVLVSKDVFHFGVWQWGFLWISGPSLNVMECNFKIWFYPWRETWCLWQDLHVICKFVVLIYIM